MHRSCCIQVSLPDQVQECVVLQLESDLEALLAQIFNRQKTMAAFRPSSFPPRDVRMGKRFHWLIGS